MKKKLFFIIALACCLVLTVGILAACNDSGTSGQQTPGTENPGNETPGDNNPGGEVPGTGETPEGEDPGTTDPSLEESTPGLEFVLNSDQSSYAVSGYTGSTTDVVIPSTHQGLPVTNIGYSAFYNCDTLTSVIITSGVTSIGVGAFLG